MVSFIGNVLFETARLLVLLLQGIVNSSRQMMAAVRESFGRLQPGLSTASWWEITILAAIATGGIYFATKHAVGNAKTIVLLVSGIAIVLALLILII